LYKKIEDDNRDEQQAVAAAVAVAVAAPPRLPVRSRVHIAKQPQLSDLKQHATRV
jgi:hypothetical protein